MKAHETDTGRDGTRNIARRSPGVILMVGLVIPLLFLSRGHCSGASADIFSLTPGEEATCPSPPQQPLLSVLPESARLSERIFGLRGLSNVGRVSPELFRGAQPLPEGYQTLKELGIRTVLNLGTKPSQRAPIEAAGILLVEVPVKTSDNLTPEVLRSVMSVLTDPANQPVYIHGVRGYDVAALVVAFYRIDIEGWPLDLAEAEMRSFGFIDTKNTLRKVARDLESTGKK